MNERFDDLDVMVTGGAGALGSAVVARLLDLGAVCHVPCHSQEELARFELAEREGVRVYPEVNLADEATVGRVFGAAAGAADRGGLWASIHIAGGFAMGPIAETGADVYERMMSMNARTCFLCCRDAARYIRAREGGPDGGRIVNVAARPALEPRTGAGMVAYTASKAAVAAMTVALGEELAAESIWVNAVAPSIMDTPANRGAMPDADHGSWPKVDEVAETIVWLASPANASTRGCVAPVYGRS